MKLLPQHAQLLRDSAISDEVAEQRGYFSVSRPGDLNGRFPNSQRLAPALVVPIHNVWGEQVFCQLRPDEPRAIDGRTVRYETPRGARLVIDVPPAVRPRLGDPKCPLIVTEGARKADAAVSVGLNAVNLLGVSGWKGRNADGGITALDDWSMVALNDGRLVYICFDSDAMTKSAVHAEVIKLARHLENRGATVRIIYLPHGADGSKLGLDDFLAQHSRDELLALASDKLRPLASDAPAPTVPDVPLRAVCELLDAAEAFLRRYLVLSEEQFIAIVLWIAHTHALAASGSTIYLHITSPEYESGKTRLLEGLEVLVPGPLLAANVTTAVLYRAIEKWGPVLLLDEADNLFGDKDSKRELFAS